MHDKGLLRRVSFCIGVAIVLLSGVGGVSIANPAVQYEACVVQFGQSLNTIAQDYGLPVDYLAQFNRLVPTAPLQPGQVLMVPIVAQLAPQFPGSMPQATAITESGNQVSGLLGTIVADRVEIRSRPDGGETIFRNTTRGSEMLVVGQSDTHFALLMSDGSMGWVPKTALALSQRRLTVPRPNVGSNSEIVTGEQTVVDAALKYLGVPYKYGGKLPNSVDCSLLVQTVFSQCGRSLPRTAAQQFTIGEAVERDALLPGDRVYFYDKSGKIGHTGIYMGDDRFVHASSNRSAVAIDSLSDSAYVRTYAGARR